MVFLRWLFFSCHLNRTCCSCVDQEAENGESKLQAEGEGFLFKSLEERNSRPQKTYWVLKAVFIKGAVIAFSVVFIMSYFVIFCDKLVIKGWSS